VQFQAAEREQERDEYQQKLNQMEVMIKERDRRQGASERLSTQVRNSLLSLLTIDD
jgi:hypothetical protein